MGSLAQATGTPNSGASNAEDFQPLTRNPQPTQGGLQPGTGPQSTGTQDILNDENARIVVPAGGEQAQPAQAVAPPKGGINWLLVVLAAAVIVIVFEYFFRRREKAPRPAIEFEPQPEEQPPADESLSAPEPEAPAEKPVAVTKKKTTKAPAKKKSKSKRKKSRK